MRSRATAELPTTPEAHPAPCTSFPDFVLYHLSLSIFPSPARLSLPLRLLKVSVFTPGEIIKVVFLKMTSNAQSFSPSPFSDSKSLLLPMWSFNQQLQH